MVLEPSQAFSALTSTGLFFDGQLASGCALVPGETGLRLEITLTYLTGYSWNDGWSRRKHMGDSALPSAFLSQLVPLCDSELPKVISDSVLPA